MTAPVQPYHVMPYAGGCDAEITDLVLSIQNGEAGLGLTIEDQPDLRDVMASYANGGFWIAAAGNRIIGTIGLLRYGERAAIKKFFVATDFRGRGGPAERLFDSAMRYAEKNGLSDVFLDTPALAVRSHSFYHRMGFEPMDRDLLPQGYAFPDRDSLIFRRALTLRARGYGHRSPIRR